MINKTLKNALEEVQDLATGAVVLHPLYLGIVFDRATVVILRENDQ